jgi:DNA-binding IclR family transcriptional regulator
MLRALQSLGYVRRSPTRGYSLSLRIVELGGKILQKLAPVQAARPFMVRLAAETGETVNLGVLEGVDIICVEKVESEHHLRLEQPIGTRVTAYHAAMGKAVLAFLPPEELRRILHVYPIIGSTPNSHLTVSAIDEDLASVRSRGYATDMEESIIGVRCVGAPIFDWTGGLRAGVSVAGPAVRMTDEQMACFGGLVAEAARAITRQLAA